ncbi:MAG: LLM class flavin-dependent oxidoreductase, partial [Solirubrobacteraceae bacterium]
MPKPFRFAVQISALPADGWIERVRSYERLGYSTVFCPDHFGPQWDPTALLAAAAAVTTRLNVGSLVYDVDYRHPVIHAKAGATIQLLSGGRHEFGIGAGWMRTDYDEAGMAYDRPGVRIERLEEALQIIRSMWENERTSFEGKHYKITNIAKAAELPTGSRPKILIGGGGPRVLRLAGRHADIVGINPSLPEGKITPNSAADLAPERLDEKLAAVRAGAEA